MSTAPERHHFTSTTFFIWSGLLIWMSNFIAVYVFAALACARQFADVRWMGIGIVPFVTALCSAAATIATVLILRRAWRARQHETEEHSRFIRFVAFATSLLALIGLIYVVLPPVLFASHCTGGA